MILVSSRHIESLYDECDELEEGDLDEFRIGD